MGLAFRASGVGLAPLSIFTPGVGLALDVVHLVNRSPRATGLAGVPIRP